MGNGYLMGSLFDRYEELNTFPMEIGMWGWGWEKGSWSPFLISRNQNAFVVGHQRLGFVLIANENMNAKLKSMSLGIICKIYSEGLSNNNIAGLNPTCKFEAHDYVKWNFLLFVLDMMSSGFRWRKWISFYSQLLDS